MSTKRYDSFYNHVIFLIKTTNIIIQSVNYLSAEIRVREWILNNFIALPWFTPKNP